MFASLKAWLSGEAVRAKAATAAREKSRAAVQRYPEHAPPHPGSAREITPQQAQTNLDWFLDTVPRRMETLRGLLAEFGVPAAPDGPTLDAVDAWIARIIAWIDECWPETPLRPEHTQEDVWLYAKRVGDDAIFRITLDLATCLGQVAINMEPRWRWGLDMDHSNLRDAMLTSHRVVMTTAPLGFEGVRPCKDWEALVVGQLC